MAEPTPLITFTQKLQVGDFKVEPDNVMVLPGVELYEVGDVKTHEAPTKIGEGILTISPTSLTFTGESTTVTFPLTRVSRMLPYENAIDIYQKGLKEAVKFMWGNKINMKLVGLLFDDGKVKPLEGRMVAQFIINEKNRLGNLRLDTNAA